MDTRLRKLDEGLYDAIVLASAGLHRLGLESRIAEILEPEMMAPAVGQGALGVEIRTNDDRVREALAPLHHAETAAAVSAERALLHALGGGCQLPLGAYARLLDGALRLDAVVVSDERGITRAGETGPVDDPEGLGREVAAQLRRRGVEL